MSIIPRQQVIPFSVPAGLEVDLTFNTKYDHHKVTGVVLLPDRNIHGDTIFLEINRETILPRGFNAGLIAFRQFLNKDMQRNTYQFEEWAEGSDVRIIYKNNSARAVNIDMILFTNIGDTQPITKRKKLQIVPVPYTKNDFKIITNIQGYRLFAGYEPCEVRTKTDFYYDELIGVFVDYYATKHMHPDMWLSAKLKSAIEEFINIYALFGDDRKQEAEKLQKELENKEELIPADKFPVNEKDALVERYENFINILNNALAACLSDIEPVITQKNLNALQDSIEFRFVYDDKYQSFSTFELSVNTVPFYPKNFQISTITPRYRKSFNETIYRTSMPVKEADIFIAYSEKWLNSPNVLWETGKDMDNYYPLYDSAYNCARDFSVYFLYNKTVKQK